MAEFDEDIPWDEREAELKKEEELSKVEQEIAMLDKEVWVFVLECHENNFFFNFIINNKRIFKKQLYFLDFKWLICIEAYSC